MKFTDRILQHWRISRARRLLQPGDRILDIGSADGALFSALGAAIGRGSLGVDPTLQQKVLVNGCELLPGFFPAAVPAAAGPFDAITLLAVLEHFPPAAYDDLRAGCRRFLRPGGKLLITVPSPHLDQVLEVLSFLRLVDGMSLEEHHGCRVEQTAEIFSEPHFRLERHETFQLGLNNFFAFERTATP